MLAVIGFIVMCIIGLYFSVLTILYMADSWAKYNFGGIPNTWKKKLSVFIPLGITIGIWYFIYVSSPFAYVG